MITARPFLGHAKFVASGSGRGINAEVWRNKTRKWITSLMQRLIVFSKTAVWFPEDPGSFPEEKPEVSREGRGGGRREAESPNFPRKFPGCFPEVPRKPATRLAGRETEPGERAPGTALQQLTNAPVWFPEDPGSFPEEKPEEGLMLYALY